MKLATSMVFRACKYSISMHSKVKRCALLQLMLCVITVVRSVQLSIQI